MGRIAAFPLALAAVAAAVLVSGDSGADPRTPPALPGTPAPFLGTAVVGNGGLLAGIDAYGNLVDLRSPGPAGGAQIDNPFERQAAGSVPADTGIVLSVGAGGPAPLPLWRAGRLSQRYLRGTNVLRTSAVAGNAPVLIEEAAAGSRLARRITARAPAGQPLTLRLDVNLALGGSSEGDSVRPSPSGFVQRDGSRVVRCRTAARSSLHAGDESGEPVARLTWRGRGVVRAELACSFAGPPQSAAVLIRRSIAADRRWLARSRTLGAAAPAWARRMYARSLLVLRALTDSRSGATVAGARDHWAYVWPRDAGIAAIALAASGYRRDARRVVRFLSALDLDAGARFRGDSSAFVDGRALPGDAAGWVRAARLAVGMRAPVPPAGAWRDRGDYGELAGDRGDFLANAIAGGASAAQIRHLFASRAGLHRRAGDPGSGLDSAAAWAVRPFPRPRLFGLVRRSLIALGARTGHYGVKPTQDWPDREAWTAPVAWSAWSLAVLGDRSGAMRLMERLRRASTPAGMIPERVGPANGLPRSTTPLGWSHAFAALALRQLYPRR